MATAKEQIAANIATVTKTKGVVESATVALNGWAQRLKDAIASALDNGATSDELQPLTDLHVATDLKVDELATAIAANP